MTETARNTAEAGAGRTVDVTLIVPPGLDERIFPWGVHCLADYLAATGAPARTRILNFSTSSRLALLRERHLSLLGDLFALLRSDALTMVFGHTTEPGLFLGLVAAAGDRFFDVGHEHDLFVSHRRARKVEAERCRELRQFCVEYRSALIEPIKHSASGPAPKLWGISVYDFTLLNSLQIAAFVAEVDPRSAIVLGGDYFDRLSATTLIENADHVDGIVVGYGEEIFRSIVIEYSRHGRIDGIRANGLVNQRGQADVGDAESSFKISIPPSYVEAAPNPPGDYVRLGHNGEVHILTQRGCSWGHCTFCSQLDRRLHFPVNEDHVLEKVTEAIHHRKVDLGERRAFLKFDADENDLAAVLPVLQRALDESAPEGPVTADFWMMVQKFQRDLPEFASSAGHRLDLRVKLNIESLNVETLRHMRKGHTALGALEAVKGVMDAGQIVKTNYFVHYPLESCESVRGEVALLVKAVHLLSPPSTVFAGFPYSANNRDDIAEHPDLYGTRVTRMRRDVWIAAAMGLDLPFSIWAFTATSMPSRRLSDLIEQTYRKRLEAEEHAEISELGRRLFPQARMLSRRYPLQAAARRIKVWARSTLQHLCEGLLRDDSYSLRSSITASLEALAQRSPTEGESESPRWVDGFSQLVWRWLPRGAATKLWRRLGPWYPPRLYLAGDVLVKDYALPFIYEKWERRLTVQELAVLRGLYWATTLSDLGAALAGRVDAGQIDAIVKGFVANGVILSERGRYLSLANDPELWTGLHRANKEFLELGSRAGAASVSGLLDNARRSDVRAAD